MHRQTRHPSPTNYCNCAITSLSLYNNKLNGTLPAVGTWMPNLSVLEVRSNMFVGTIDLTGLTKLVTLGIDYNYFSEFPTPSTPAPVNLSSLIFTDQLLKSIPSPDWLSQLTALTVFELSIDPEQRLPFPTFWANHPLLEILGLNDAGLVGTMPAVISAPRLTYVYLSGNRLTGSFPVFTPSWTPISLEISGNQLGGYLPAPLFGGRLAHGSILLDDNRFVGPFTDAHIPPPWAASSVLNLKNNPLCGTVLNISSPDLGFVDLSGIALDYCANPPVTLSNLDGCNLLNMPYPESICPCASNYSICQITPVVNCSLPAAPAGATPYGASSYAAQFCRAPVTSCPQPPPQGSFACAPDGTWQVQGDIIQPQVTIPYGGTLIVVSGNLTVTEGVTFSGLGGQLIVDGCVTIGPGGVVIELTKEEFEKLPKGGTKQTLIKSLSGNNCTSATDLTTVHVTVKVPKSCKRLKSNNGNQDSTSTRSSLVVLFEVDTSRCNMAAIIAPSVVGGAVILAVVVTLAITQPWKKLSTSELHKAK